SRMLSGQRDGSVRRNAPEGGTGDRGASQEFRLLPAHVASRATRRIAQEGPCSQGHHDQHCGCDDRGRRHRAWPPTAHGHGQRLSDEGPLGVPAPGLIPHLSSGTTWCSLKRTCPHPDRPVIGATSGRENKVFHWSSAKTPNRSSSGGGLKQ